MARASCSAKPPQSQPAGQGPPEEPIPSVISSQTAFPMTWAGNETHTGWTSSDLFFLKCHCTPAALTNSDKQQHSSRSCKYLTSFCGQEITSSSPKHHMPSPSFQNWPDGATWTLHIHKTSSTLNFELYFLKPKRRVHLKHKFQGHTVA